MVQVQDTGPPVPGTLRVVVVRANSLRNNAAGDPAAPMVKVRLRPTGNPRAQDSQVFETNSTRDAEWQEEFFLPVQDANQTQLEVTIWDTSEVQAFPATFMGECILNLFKLVPYQGEIVMQDFDVKQGKQFKTQVQACGKLSLILELTGSKPKFSPITPVQQPVSVVLAPGQEQHAMNIMIVEARDLVKNLSPEPDSYVCVSLLDDPASMESRHFVALDHGIGEVTRDIIVLSPQHRTRIVPFSLNPSWNDGCTLIQAHPSIRIMEQAQLSGNTSAEKVPLIGTSVLLMFTVHNHTADCTNKDGFLGRVVIPQIRVGQPVDQWFVLQTLEGKELLSVSGKQSKIRIKIFYGLASEVENIGDPYTIPHSNPHAVVLPASHPHALAPVPTFSAARPVPIKGEAQSQMRAPTPTQGQIRSQTPESSVRPSTPQIIQTLAGKEFAFYLEVVEARNLPKPGGSTVSDSYVCISLFHDPASMNKHQFFMMDHYLKSQAEDSQFLQLPPQFTSKSISGDSGAVWNDSCALKGAHPAIKTILNLKSLDRLSTSTEIVELAGQTVMLLATVHDNTQSSFLGRVLIPQIRVGQPVDQWFMLQARDGSQIKDAKGQDAAIRLRFAYGSLKEKPPELPPGWERKVDDATGKTFYVNHELKTFSWVPPPKTLPTPPSSGETPVEQGTAVKEEEQRKEWDKREEEREKREEEEREKGEEEEGKRRETVRHSVAAKPLVQRSAPTVQRSAPEAQVSAQKPTTQGHNGPPKVSISIRQGKDLPRMDHLSLSNAYVCVSIIGDADKIDEATVARMYHDVTKNKLRAGLRSSLLKFFPLHRTKVVKRSLNPKWEEVVEFSDAYLNVQAIESMQQKGFPKEGERKPLLGSPVLIVISVHHEVDSAEDSMIGRVIIPLLQPGDQLDDWFPLIHDGKPQVGGMNEKPSQLDLQITYEAESATNCEQESVPFTLTLDADLHSIGDKEAFKQDVIEDVATAAKIDSKHVRVIGLRAGSVLVDMLISKEAGDALKIVQNLEEQLESPNSLLRQGKVTSKAKRSAAISNLPEFEAGPTEKEEQEALQEQNSGALQVKEQEPTCFEQGQETTREAEGHQREKHDRILEQNAQEQLALSQQQAQREQAALERQHLEREHMQCQMMQQQQQQQQQQQMRYEQEQQRQAAEAEERIQIGLNRAREIEAERKQAEKDKEREPEIEEAKKERDLLTQQAEVARRQREMIEEEAKKQRELQAMTSNSVEFQLKLSLDYNAVGQQGSPAQKTFEQNIIQDLSNASSHNPSSFHIKKLSPGSVIVDALITADPSGWGLTPQGVAAELERQSKDPFSLLRNGNLTCYLEAIGFPCLRPDSLPIPPKLHQPEAPSAIHPPKPSMHQGKLFVFVFQARNLPQTFSNCGCNAFCELSMNTFGQEAPFARTSTSLSSWDPVWSDVFLAGVDPDQIYNSELTLSLFDWDPKTQNHHLLGLTRKFGLSDLIAQVKTNGWFDVFTEGGFTLGNHNGPASICLGIEYEAPFVQARVDVSPPLTSMSLHVKTPRTSASSGNRGKASEAVREEKYIRDEVPIIGAPDIIDVNSKSKPARSAAPVTSMGGRSVSPGGRSVSPPRAASHRSSGSPINAPPLPPGWERFKDKNGQYFYVDHETKQRSRMDPRLGGYASPGRVSEASLSFLIDDLPLISLCSNEVFIRPHRVSVVSRTEQGVPNGPPLDVQNRVPLALTSADPRYEAGVGIVLSIGPHSEHFVHSLLDGGPAALSNKVLRGDVLQDVDGLSITDMPLSQVQRMLAGESYSPVTMTFLRHSGRPTDNGLEQIIVTLCRKKLSGGSALTQDVPLPLSTGTAIHLGRVIGAPDMIAVNSKPKTVRSAGPPALSSAVPNGPVLPEQVGFRDVVARAPSPSESVTSNSSNVSKLDFSNFENPALHSKIVKEAQQRADELRRKEQEAIDNRCVNSSRPSNPFAHLKSEFSGLMSDLYGNQINHDPALTAALAWKKKLLYGDAKLKTSQNLIAPATVNPPKSPPTNVQNELEHFKGV